MSDYRFYLLRTDGEIDRPRRRRFDNDGEALAFARQLLDIAPGIEIWNQETLVTRLVSPGRLSRAA